jgi:hypothetical protein
MIKKTLSISIASPPDREKLVAEIFFDNEQFAELNQESETLNIEVYPRRDNQVWQLDYEQVITAFLKAKNKLLGE